MNDFATPPEADELEISVFGKGVGECSVIHIGQGRWVVIDSLLDDDRRPIGLSYLSNLGVDVGLIQVVALTHWHDDHIRGAAQLISEAGNAHVAYSSVLRRDEFSAAVTALAPARGLRFTSGVKELQEISSILKGQPERRRLASAQRTIFEDGSIRIEALSPSDEDTQLFLQEIAGWAVANDVDQAIPIPNRNDTSVVIVVSTGDDFLLFGADLEIRGALSGWQGLHSLYWNDRGRCSFYKVAHHGSQTSHYEPMWSNMLQPEVQAVLTPYGRGRKKLPSDEDVARIAGCTANGYSAGNGRVLRGRRQHNSVERTLAEANIKLQRISSKLGQVRLRRRIGQADWAITLFGEGHRLDKKNYPDAFAAN